VMLGSHLVKVQISRGLDGDGHWINIPRWFEPFEHETTRRKVRDDLRDEFVGLLCWALEKTVWLPQGKII